MNPQQLTIDQILISGIDPCERKSGGHESSKSAHQRVLGTKSDVYRRIMDLLKARGAYGITSKEAAAALGKQLNCISGRFSELKRMRWIAESGEKRNGASVLIAR